MMKIPYSTKTHVFGENLCVWWSTCKYDPACGVGNLPILTILCSHAGHIDDAATFTFLIFWGIFLAEWPWWLLLLLFQDSGQSSIHWNVRVMCKKKTVKSNTGNNLVVQVNKWGWFLGWPKYPPYKLIAKAPRQWWEKSFPCGFRPMFKGELLVFGKGKLCLCFTGPTNNSLNAWIVLGIVKKTLSRFIVFCRGSVFGNTNKDTEFASRITASNTCLSTTTATTTTTTTRKHIIKQINMSFWVEGTNQSWFAGYFRLLF